MLTSRIVCRPLVGKSSRHVFFFFNDPATTEIYTLSLHDALPIYAIDVQLPNMLHAAIIQCPVFKGTLKSVDETKLAGVKGIRQVVKLPDAVAVVADSWWRAKKAAELLALTWDVGDNSSVSSNTISANLHEALSAADA